MFATWLLGYGDDWSRTPWGDAIQISRDEGHELIYVVRSVAADADVTNGPLNG
jgi:hypothetical protein